MSNSNNQTVESSNSRVILLRYLEPATILTLAIGGVYYLGWLHIEYYLRRIGINHLSLNLPTSFYLKQGYLAVFGALGLLNLIVWYRAAPPKTKSDALVLNLIVFILIAAILFPYPVASRSISIVNSILIGTTAVILIVLSWRKLSAVHSFMQSDLLHRFFFLLVTFSLLSLIAVNGGALSGKNAIEGNSSYTSGITFVWKSDIPLDIEGKQLILILHHEEKYYVVERAVPAPDNPRVYVIPDEMVRYAVTTSEIK